jgi:hypothetical protein
MCFVLECRRGKNGVVNTICIGSVAIRFALNWML